MSSIADPRAGLHTHVCVPEMHTWEAAGTLHPYGKSSYEGIFAYTHPMAAICPICRKQDKFSVGKLRVQLPAQIRQLFLAATCVSRNCSKPIMVELEQWFEENPSMDTHLLGFTFWTVPHPFPIYCNACALGNAELGPRSVGKEALVASDDYLSKFF